MTVPNLFKQWLHQPTTRWGSWLMSAAPSTTEALGYSGFDFLVLDMEHVPIDTGDAIHHLRTLAATPAQAIVRLAWNDPVLVKKALDIGAQTLMFPFIETEEQARQAVASTRYPPAGTRGVAAMHRASRYGSIPDYLAQANTEIAVILQIESLEGIRNLDAIAHVDGVDGLFIGPGDLAAGLGYIGQITAPEVQSRLQELITVIHRAGKPGGCVAPTSHMAHQFQLYGFDFIAISSDLGFMMTQAKEALNQVRQDSIYRDQKDQVLLAGQ